MKFMLKFFALLAIIYLSFSLFLRTYAQNSLKYVVYDFEGYQSGSSTVPNGAYRYGDLNYQIAANPLAANDQIADRVLRLDWNWSAGYGGWGRGMAAYIDLSAATDYLNFYFYNPTTNNKSVVVTAVIAEDDNNNNIDESDPWDGSPDYDDLWKYSVTIPRSSAWQLISIRLSDFVDQNTGGTDGGTKGNGIFDAQFSPTGGSVLKVAFEISGLVSGDGAETWYIDMISFSEGPLPTGSTFLDLPPKSASDHCLLGTFDANGDAGNYHLTPSSYEGIFNPPDASRKLCIVHWFNPFSFSGTTANVYPDDTRVNNLLANGYTPMITWEPMFASLSPTHANQVTLDKINAGNYDTYIDNYADRVKAYPGTILIRLMHEMDGNWYPWGVPLNGFDATKYVNAFRRFVNRFNARGVTNVKWIWCMNSSPVPQDSRNWSRNTYPGDTYVDIVGTDIYNSPGGSSSSPPVWKSFRFEGAHSVYYLKKHFPNKPAYICEYGSRERYAADPAGSETKAQWTSRLNKEMQSNFSNLRGLVAFSFDKSSYSGEHDWRSNSTTATRDAFRSNIWIDPYYIACDMTTPVELSYWNGMLLNDEVLLTWRTESETNNRGFKIERSSDGQTFETIGFVEGAGNSGYRINYQFTDTDPYPERGYYRLIQEDLDGKTSLSQVIFISGTGIRAELLPNPSEDGFRVQAGFTISDVEIFSVNGKFVESYQYPDKEKQLGETLKPGIYLVKISGKDQVVYFRLLKK